MLNIIQAFYTSLYDRHKERSDSPDASRTAMKRKVLAALVNKGNFRPFQIINIGSGPQIIERSLLAEMKQKRIEPVQNQIVTVDIADIPERNLLARKNKAVVHYRRDANDLNCFQDGLFDIVFSNMAIDFAGIRAISEAERVLNYGGRAFFNFHHPYMLETLPYVQDPQIVDFWTYLRDNKMLFENDHQIVSSLSQIGFNSITAEYQSEREKGCGTVHHWWEVEATK